MTALEAIDRLIEAVEAGQPLARARPLPLPVYQAAYVIGAYDGSLDAAKALHESLLPGRVWEKRGGELVVQHWAVEYSHTDHDNPARAWLLAILRAHRHQIAAGGE